jgi:hypothetical protein
LAEVLACLRQHNLKVKLSKCDFFKSELRFLGYVMTDTGEKPDPNKVKAVADWPLPQTAFEVCAFLGLANYFRKFIRGFAAMTAPLNNLLLGICKHEKSWQITPTRPTGHGH